MPDIHCPFPPSRNPHADRARAHLRSWTSETGLIRTPSAQRRFARADFGEFAARVYPTAPPARLELLADWFAWLFLVDDQLDDGAFGRSPTQLTAQLRLMREVLEHPSPPAAARRSPVVDALADLWRRTAHEATPHWRRRFTDHLDACLTTATRWEAGNRMSGRVPPEAEYIANRRHTGAIYVCMDLVEIAESAEVPPALHASSRYRTALDSACNVVCWVNDVFSLAKERAYGECHNLVHLVGYHRGLSDAAALDVVRAAIDTETSRYLTAEAELQAQHPTAPQGLTGSLAGMRSWMRGNLDWSHSTHRYATALAQLPDQHLESTLLQPDE